MQIFYLLLVFREGILCTAAADKNDDSKITHKILSDIIDKFLEKYGRLMEDWSGDVRIFKGFESVMDVMLKNGHVAEVPLKIPILKIYEKNFVKSRKLLSKKGMVLSEEDLRNVQNQKPTWTSKRLPTQVITQGFLTKEQFKIAHLADGFHTIADIAEEAGVPKAQIVVMIDDLDDLGLLKFIDVK